MRKKMFSLLAIVAFISSSLDAKAINIDKASLKEIEFGYKSSIELEIIDNKDLIYIEKSLNFEEEFEIDCMELGAAFGAHAIANYGYSFEDGCELGLAMAQACNMLKLLATYLQ